MNTHDRQIMREKHRATPDNYCQVCAVVGFDGETMRRKEYPCDVITVLNATQMNDEGEGR